MPYDPERSLINFDLRAPKVKVTYLVSPKNLSHAQPCLAFTGEPGKPVNENTATNDRIVIFTI